MPLNTSPDPQPLPYCQVPEGPWSKWGCLESGGAAEGQELAEALPRLFLCLQAALPYTHGRHPLLRAPMLGPHTKVDRLTYSVALRQKMPAAWLPVRLRVSLRPDEPLGVDRACLSTPRAQALHHPCRQA